MSTQMKTETASFQPGKNPKSKTISNDYIKALQTKSVLLYNVIPAIGTVIAIASLWWYPISSVEIGLLIGMWALSMIGMSLGSRRLSLGWTCADVCGR